MDTITTTPTKNTMKTMRPRKPNKKVRIVTITPTTYTCRYTGEQWHENVKTGRWTKDHSISRIIHAPPTKCYDTSQKARDIMNIIRNGGSEAMEGFVLRVNYVQFLHPNRPHAPVAQMNVFCLYNIPKEFEDSWETKMEPYTFGEVDNPFFKCTSYDTSFESRTYDNSFEKRDSFLISSEEAKTLQTNSYNLGYV